MALVKQNFFIGGKDMQYIGIDLHSHKFTCNFIQKEANRSYRETYYINPADIRRFLNRNRDEKLHQRKMAEYDKFLEKYEKKLDKHFS